MSLHRQQATLLAHVSRPQALAFERDVMAIVQPQSCADLCREIGVANARLSEIYVNGYGADRNLTPDEERESDDLESRIHDLRKALEAQVRANTGVSWEQLWGALA